MRPGGASDGRPDRGVRTADRRPGQRQHESRRHRHPDAAERSRSGRGRHSGDIHRCGKDIPQQLLPRTAENDELPKATLHCKVDRAGGEYDVTVRSDNFARGVYLSVEGETAHFSDNFFDLMPGETRTVRVASELNAKELARRLKSMSLADTY